MRSKLSLPLALSFFAVTMALIATVREFLWASPRAFAQGLPPDRDIYVEPGVWMLRAPDGSRQVFGKIVIDLSTGKIWGFPTLVQQPYPQDATSTQPPTSEPFLLGTFDLAAIQKKQ
jgi:hypothetical protein